MSESPTFTDRFSKEIADHRMMVIRDDGLYRHLRFNRPSTMDRYFDLLTWPGCLCYTGDMGTYVFQRLEDMFAFFRNKTINLGYWEEKLLAVNAGKGAEEWSDDKFKYLVREYFANNVDAWDEKRKTALWEAIVETVYEAADDGEPFAWAALREFHHDGFGFDDWEGDAMVWTYHYQWCCHAIVWAIATYDSHKGAEKRSQIDGPQTCRP